MYRKVILGVFALFILFSITKIDTASAQLPKVPSPPDIQINQAYAFRHVLELNDILFIAAYVIEDDDAIADPPSWKDFLATAALAKVIDPSGTVIEQKSLSRLGGGIFGFYFTAVEFAANFTFGTDVTLRIDSNPTTFSTIATSSYIGVLCGDPSTLINPADGTLICSNIEKVGTGATDDWINTSTIAATKSEMETRFVRMAKSIEFEYTDNDPEEVLVEGGKINATGANIFIEAFLGSLKVAPGAFEIGTEIVSSGFNPSTFEFDVELTTLREGGINESTPVVAIRDLADQFSLSTILTSLTIMSGLTIPLYIGLRQATKSDAIAMTSISGMLVWWTSLGLIDSGLMFSLGLILWALLGVWIWRAIPTN